MFLVDGAVDRDLVFLAGGPYFIDIRTHTCTYLSCEIGDFVETHFNNLRKSCV